MEKTEFEFPDEGSENPRKGGAVVAAKEEASFEVEGEGKPEIEVVDDTPPEDRNRKPMAEPPKELSDEELDKYDESVKKRIQHFTKGYHEERRAKERAEREREEAVRVAQSIAEENKKLKGSLSNGQAALIEQAKKVVANELNDAKRKYKEAYEAGDSDALVAAQEELTSIKLKMERVNNFKPAPLQEEKTVVQPPPEARAPRPDPRVDEWTERNPWFGTNRKMTAYAVAVHEDLVQNEGVSTTSEEYFRRIDKEMRDRFPDAFESEKPADAPTQRSKPSNVVSPATRSTAPRKVVLTKSQVEIAKRLGVPLELYARKVADEMRK
jgi:hypothetical protein